MKKRIILGSILALVLVVASIGIWSSRTGKLKGWADQFYQYFGGQEQGVTTKADSIDAHPMQAGACDPNSPDNSVCRWVNTSATGPIIYPVNPRALALQEIIKDQEISAYMCSNYLMNHYTMDDLINAGKITYQVPGASCTITYLTPDIDDPDLHRLNYTFSMDDNLMVSMPATFQTSNINNQGTENIAAPIKINYEIQGDYRYDKNNKQWIPDISKHRQILTNYQGSFSVKMDATIKGHEDLWAKRNLSFSGMTFTKHIWTLDSEGGIDVKLAGSWSIQNKELETNLVFGAPFYTGQKSVFSKNFSEVQIDEEKYCEASGGCKITVEEKLDIEANKSNTGDGISGTIKSFAYHKENYSGQMASNDKGLFWQNLIVTKLDQRKWNQSLQHGLYIKSAYNGSIDSNAEIKPFNNYKKIISTENKELTLWQCPPQYRTIPGSVGSLQPGECKINFVAKVNKNETNLNNTITRGGTGSFSIVSYLTSGIYDNRDPKMLITYSTNPSYSVGSRIDPFSLAQASNFIKIYFPAGTYFVPGLFTASRGDGINTPYTISSVSLQFLPKNVVVIHAYKDGDSSFTPPVMANWNKLITDLANHGVSIQSYDAKDKQGLLDVFGQIENGALVIFLGHGGPTELMAGDDAVFDWEIKKVLSDNEIILVSDTCYLARRSFAKQVLGSIGVGISSNTSIGTIVGFNNPLNSTTGEVIKLINGIF